MKFPFYIAKRYLFSKGSTNAINIITSIAAVGIVVGAMSLFIVLSAFEGLKELHLEYTSVSDPDLKVFPKKGKFFKLSNEQKVKLKQIKGIQKFATTIEHQILLNYKEKQLTALIKGVDWRFYSVIPTDSLLMYGNWNHSEDFYVVIGNQISNTLGLGLNNFETPLDLYAPKAGKGQITNPVDAFRKESVIVTGIYQLTNDLDKRYVYTTLGLAQKILNVPKNNVTNIELKLSENADQKKIRSQLEFLFDNNIIIKNRLQLNDAMYKMLNTENLAVYMVFTLVLIVALFNLIGALIMIIIDKKSNLKTLFKMGTTITQIRSIFFIQGMLMTFLGGIVGIILGLILLVLQQQFNLIMINYELAYPIKISLANVIKVLTTLYLLGIIASAIAALSIKKSLIAR